MTVTIGRSDWSLFVRGRGQESARVRCPLCRQLYALDHSITANGDVQPSVDCPTQGCGFHDYVRLEGWATREEARV